MALRVFTHTLAELTIRYFSGKIPSRGRFTIQMLSDDLSADTTWNLEVSADGITFANAQESGIDISGTLVAQEPTVRTFEGNPGDTWQITFAGATTGVVEIVVNGV